jgi:hypothetical protein
VNRTFIVTVDYRAGWPDPGPRRVERVVTARSEHEAHAKARDGLPPAAYVAHIITNAREV